MPRTRATQPALAKNWYSYTLVIDFGLLKLLWISQVVDDRAGLLARRQTALLRYYVVSARYAPPHVALLRCSSGRVVEGQRTRCRQAIYAMCGIKPASSIAARLSESALVISSTFSPMYNFTAGLASNVFMRA